MKNRIIYLLALSLISFSALAQIDRSQPPKPGPAPEIKLGEAASFTLKNGLKVYVVENHKLPRVAFSLSLDRDPLIEGENAGYVSMAGQLLRNGTKNRTKAQLDEEVDFIGASLSASSSGVFGSSLTKHTDKLLELMTDVLYNPAFPEEELDKLKKQTLSGLASAKDDPSAIAGNVRQARLYGENHPYGELTTEQTVEKIDIEACKAYYKKYFKPSIAYLAIVGDIDVKGAKKLAKQYFASWESGDVPKVKYEVPEQPGKTYVALVDRPASVQSVINVTYPLNLKPGTPDVIKARVMNQILGAGFSSRLMQNLREDKAFTYGARSSLSSDRLVGNFNASASVRNEVTDSAVYEFMYELKKMISEEVTEDELKAAKASIMGSFARSMESPQTVARFAINTAIYNLPADYYSNYLKNLDAVTLADVKEMAQKYIKPENAHIVVVGKGSEIADKLGKFGEVQYFDMYGKSYDPKTAVALPAGLTAEKVLKKYIDAIGGKESISKVKDLTIISNASMMGRDIKITQKMMTPNKSFMEMNMGGMVVSKQVFDGKNASVSQMGQQVPIDDKTLKETAIGSTLFSEMKYADLGVKTKLTGVEQIDGADAYVIELELPTGSKATHYFGVESGLKVRESKTSDTPQGSFTQTVTFSDYKAVDGVKYPYKMSMSFGPQNMNAEVVSIEVNTGITADDFKK